MATEIHSLEQSGLSKLWTRIKDLITTKVNEVKINSIALTGDVTGTGNKGSNGKITVNTVVGDNSHKHNYTSIDSIYDENVMWGGNDRTYGFGAMDAAIVSELGTNSFAGINSGVKFEYSRDGGKTWTDYESSTYLYRVFTQKTTNDFPPIRIGGGDGTEVATTDWQTRITIDSRQAHHYAEIKKLIFFTSTEGCSFNLEVRVHNYSSTGEYVGGVTEWETIKTNFKPSGWSGWSVINTSFITYEYYVPNPPIYYKDKIEFTFKTVNVSSSTYNHGGLIYKIQAYGTTVWKSPSYIGQYGSSIILDGDGKYVTDRNIKLPSNRKLEGTATNADKVNHTLTIGDKKFDGSSDVTVTALKGDPGAAATVTIGTTSTGAAGTNANVTNTGTTNAAILNFTIPKGSKGDTGDAGNLWYFGNKLTGTSTTDTQFTESGISLARKNDGYVNTNNFNVYICTVTGNSTTARWKYVGHLRGNAWHTGTGITGNSTVGTVFRNSGVSYAYFADMYLNTSTGYVYQCSLEGNATVAKWVYRGSIRGPQGFAGDNGNDGEDGQRGSKWYTGKAVGSANSQYVVTSISDCLVGDMYLNESTGNIHQCTQLNTGTSTWTYRCNILGPTPPIATSISSTSSHNEVPSAKCMYDLIGDVESALISINNQLSKL